MAVAAGILIFGLMARAFLESGLVSWMPDPSDVAVAAVAGVVAVALAGWLGAPARHAVRPRRASVRRAHPAPYEDDSRAFDVAPDSTDIMPSAYDDDRRFR